VTRNRNQVAVLRRYDAQWASGAGMNGAYLPLTVSLGYLLGTFVLFLLGPLAVQVDNVPLLAGFVLSSTGLFWLGYHLSIVQTRPLGDFGGANTPIEFRFRLALLAAGCWFVLFSVASLAEYGATSLGDILQAALSPSSSYFNKFAVYASQQETGRTSLPIQIAVITGALYGVLVPFTVYFWRRLRLLTRVFAVTATLLYLGYFVYIGTQKGVGDLLVMGAAALAVTALPLKKRSRSGTRTRSRWWLVSVCVTLLALGFVGYMANNLGDRLQGTTRESQYEPNPVVASVFGEKFARGLSVAIFYPTHGYLGLSKNLSVPFVWADGFGGSPALSSYKAQYLGGDDPAVLAYPARTESATGWPAGKLWATAYPWLASDLTFPGAALFMGVLGWFMARMWVGARLENDPLSLVLFCQAAIFIAYVPANNQLMTARYTAIGIITLIGLYAVRRLLGTRRRSGPRPVEVGRRT